MKAFNVFFLLMSLTVLIQCKSTQSASGKPTATLINTYWKLAEANGERIETPAGVREVHIILTVENNENRLKGFAGCNNIGGSFKQDQNKLTFSAFSTKMMCPNQQMKLENFLLDLLSATDNYLIKGEDLMLLEGDTELAIFKAVYLK